jgi:hypothetical protein
LVLAGAAMRREYAEMADDESESPKMVVLNGRSRLIRDRAVELAADQREDHEAVTELSRMAKGKPGDLKAAARYFRWQNQHAEDPIANRSLRLLQAAITGTPVQPVGPTEAEAMARLTEVQKGSRQQRFVELVELEPRLADLEAQARAGELGRLPQSTQLGHGSDHLDVSVFVASTEILQRLRATVASLVGPDAATDDVVLRSTRARLWATTYLQQIITDESPTIP